MVQLVERLASDMRKFAPELVADPKVSLFRVYRDTRFSSDKTPYKTHVAARFPMRSFPRGEGAGLPMEIAPGWVWIGGGGPCRRPPTFTIFARKSYRPIRASTAW